MQLKSSPHKKCFWRQLYLEDDSRSDADYYEEKSTLTSSSISRNSTYSITIADSSDKPKKNQKTLLSFKQAKSEQEPTLNDVMESINNLSIEIKKMTSYHNKMENVLNNRNQPKTLERVKKVENINEIMGATDLIEWLYDESSACGVLRCILCFKLHEISKPHIFTLTSLRAQRILNFIFVWNTCNQNFLHQGSDQRAYH